MLFQTDNTQGFVQTIREFAIGDQAVRPERAMKHLAQGRATSGAAPWVSNTEQTTTPCKGKTIHNEKNGDRLAADKKGFEQCSSSIATRHSLCEHSSALTAHAVALTGRTSPPYSKTQGVALGYEVLPFQGAAAEKAGINMYIFSFDFSF